MIIKTTDIRIKKLDRDELPQNLGYLIDEFITLASEFERTPVSVLGQIDYALRKSGGFWLITNLETPIGYFFTEIVPTEYGTWVCLIHQLYIRTRYAKQKLVNQVDAIVAAWARNNNAREVVFYTRRNPTAFNRLLGSHWNVDSFILKRDV